MLCSSTPHTTPIDLFSEYEDSLTSYNIESINYLVEGILKSNTVNLAELVNSVDYDYQPGSLYKKFQRFFSKELDLSPLGLFSLEYHLKYFVSNRNGCSKIFILIDRHTWEFGSKVFNLLTINFYDEYTNIEFPIVAIDLDKPGNSNTDTRIKLLNDISCILRPYINNKSIHVTVLGDREFIGNDWFDYIMLNFDSGIFRIKRNFKINDTESILDIYDSLEVNEVFETVFDNMKIIIKRLPDCPGRRDNCLALISLDSSLNSIDILNEYNIRWKIERSFFNIETNGFNLQDTHLNSSKRIQMMFYILVVCYYMSTLAGFIENKIKPSPVKKHGYIAVSLFLRGRRYIKRLISGLSFILLSVRYRSNYIFAAILEAFGEQLMPFQCVSTGVL